MIALLLFAAAVAVPPEIGTLCFQNDCTTTEGSVISVTASEAPRTFAWSSDDGKRVVLGNLAAKASSITLDDKALSEMTLSIRGDRRRGWPAEVRVAVTAGKTEWRFPIAAKAVEKLTAIRVPPGSYRLSIACDHHITEMRRVNAAKGVALREIALKPLPAIAGSIVTAKDQPIPNVQLMRPDGKIQATADEQGRFRTELSEPIPDSILMMQSGFATKIVPLENLSAENDLGAISLSRGVTVKVKILRPDAEEVPLEIHLFAHSEKKYGPTPIASRHLGPKENDLSFQDLGSGTYFATFAGTDPPQRLTEKIEVADHDVEKEIRITPFRLAGSVHLGDEALKNGSVEVQDPSHSLRIPLQIDDAGHFGGTMWQHGSLFAFVNTPDIHELVQSPELGADPSAWDISFRKRFISGRIFDEETKQALEHPSLMLQWTGEGGQSYKTLSVTPDGKYSIAAIKAGTYDLKVQAPDYVPVKTTIEIADADESKQIDFPLSRGIQQVVEFLWPSGAAVANAGVLEGVNRDGHNPERSYSTDGAGRLNLNLRRGETKTLYILPAEGSFAIAHVVAPQEADAKPVQVIVPPATASLRVEARDRDGKPSSAFTVIRYNGELLPQPLIMRLSENYGGSTFPRLPAGAYEIWAVVSRFERLIGVVPNRPPERVSLTAGNASVSLVAEPLD